MNNTTALKNLVSEFNTFYRLPEAEQIDSITKMVNTVRRKVESDERKFYDGYLQTKDDYTAIVNGTYARLKTIYIRLYLLQKCNFKFNVKYFKTSSNFKTTLGYLKHSFGYFLYHEVDNELQQCYRAEIKHIKAIGYFLDDDNEHIVIDTEAYSTHGFQTLNDWIAERDTAQKISKACNDSTDRFIVSEKLLGLENTEIAKLLGISKQAVGQRLNRIYERYQGL